MYRKVSSKVLSFLLISVFLFQICLDPAWAGSMDPETAASSADMAESADAYAETSAAIEPADEESYIVGEIDALREANAKQFRMSDGQISKAVYAEPIHFERDGRWADIDNTLLPCVVASGNAEYRNAANNFDLRIAKDADQNNMLSLSEGDYRISFSALYDPADYLRQWSGEKGSAAATARKLASEVKEVLPSAEELKADPYTLNRTETELTYKGVKPGVDFQYIPTNTGVKENIVVNTPQKSGYEYSFSLSLAGLGARLSEAGEIELYDEANPDVVKYKFPAPFMYDASGEESYDVSYELKEVKDFKTLRTGLTPAIEAAGQAAVFAEIDKAAEQEKEPVKTGTLTEDTDKRDEPAKQDDPSNVNDPVDPADPAKPEPPKEEDPVSSEKPVDEATTAPEAGARGEVKTASAAAPAKEGAGTEQLPSGEAPPASGETPPAKGEEDVGEESPVDNEGVEGTADDEQPYAEEEVSAESPVKEETPEAEVAKDPIAEKNIALKRKLTKENLYIFTIKADAKWVDDTARAFPVTIDPVLSRLYNFDSADGSLFTNCVHRDQNGTPVAAGHAFGTDMHVGRNSANGYGSFYFHYEMQDKKLPAVSKAVFRLQSFKPPKDKEIAIVKVDEDTDTASSDPASLWNMDTGGDAKDIIDFGKVKRYKAKTSTAAQIGTPYPINEFDITKLFAHKDSADIDFEVVAYKQTEKYVLKTKPSTSGAFLVLTYRQISGLEEYWTTHDQGAGRAGSGHVNDYTGQLSFIHEDVSTPGVRMPAALQHVYNSEGDYYRGFSTLTNAGANWRLGYDQTLTFPVGEADTATYPYVWTDGDGTKHFFKSAAVQYFNGEVDPKTKKTKITTVTAASGGAADEDGLGLYVVPVTNAALKANYPYKIVNTSGSLNMYFDKGGHLALIRDSNQTENSSNSASKDKNQIEIIRAGVTDKSTDAGEWPALLADLTAGRNTGWLSSAAAYGGNPNAQRESELKELFSALYKKALYVEENDPFLRINKTIQGKLATIKAKLAELCNTPSANFGTRSGNLDACITDVNSILTTIASQNLATVFYSRITTIKDAVGIEIDIDYDSATSSGRIQSISDPRKANGYLTYGYDSSGNMTSITYPLRPGASQSRVSSYEYDTEGRMISAEDHTSYKVGYAYDSFGRVTGISESENGSSGQAYRIEYGAGKTAYTFSGKDDVLGDAASDTASQDDVSTTYLFDASGRTTTSYSSLGNGEFLGGSAQEYVNASDSSHNKIKQSAEGGIHTKNYLKNHSFERKGANSEWHKYDNFSSQGSNTLYTAAFDNASPLIGLCDAKIGGSSSFQTGIPSAPKVSGYAQDMLLPAGAYIFSGYVKASALSEGASANLRVVKGSNSPLGGLLDTSGISNPVTGDTDILSNVDIPSTTVADMNGGWVRLSVRFTLEQQARVVACAELRNCTAGTVYFDCLQLEKGDVPNTYNILEDSSFELAAADTANPAPWTFSNGAGSAVKSGKVVSDSFAFDGSKHYVFTGELGKNKTLSAPLNVGSMSASYILSGRIRFEDIMPLKSDRKLQLQIYLPKTKTAAEKLSLTKVLHVPIDGEWLYFNIPMAKKNWNKQIIRIMANNIGGEIHIDDLQLARKDITSAEYTSGNMTKKIQGSETTTYTYGSNKLVSTVTSPAGNVTTYTYDAVTSDLLTQKETVGTSVTMVTYRYDRTGNQIQAKMTHSGGAANVVTSAQYTGGGRFLSYAIDSRGKKTEYTYDPVSGDLLDVKSPGNSDNPLDKIETENTYNDIGQVTEVTSGGKTVTYSYGAKDELASVSHNGFGYSFEYDEFGNTEDIAVAGQSLVGHEYAAGNGKLLETTYGNGFSVQPVYDEHEQKVSEIWSEATAGGPVSRAAYEVLYDSEDRPAVYYDKLEDRRYEYDYDSMGRLRRQFAYDEESGDKLYETENAYTIAGQPLSLYYGIGGEKGFKYIYAYEKDGRANKVTLPNGSYKGYAYDPFKRITAETYNPIKTTTNAKTLKTNLTYLPGNADTATGGAATATTSLVKTHKNTIGTTIVDSYEYTYTDLGNIRTVKDTVANKTTTYHYGELSYLTREDNEAQGKTTVYEYDDGGNITETKEYAYQSGASVTGTPTATRSYTYAATGWKDQLTGYDSGQGMQDIVYDEIGNPNEYLGRELTWQYGRRLMSIDENAATTDDDISYVYSSDGTRLSKIAGDQKVEHIIIGGALVRDVYSESGTMGPTLNYYYDSNGLLTSIGYKGAPGTANSTTERYYFVTRNLQGDITALYNSANSTLVGTYTYDSWGRVTAVKDANGMSVSKWDTWNILNLNPFRYRGYYYDRETGFYYLQSRYYDPETGRFLNADGLISTGTGVTGYNMYAYCNNNPVSLADPTGTCATCAARYAIANPKPFFDFENNKGGYGYPAYLANMRIWQNGYDQAMARTHRDVTNEVVAAVNKVEKAFAAHNTAVAPKLSSVATHNAIATINTSWFVSQVASYAPWDVKRKSQWERTIGTSFPGKDVPVKFRGGYLNAEAIGNITYGYLGLAAGYDGNTLKRAADIVAGPSQDNEGKWTWADARWDQEHIDIGLKWYEDVH